TMPAAGTAATLNSSNCSWSFTTINAAVGSGITASASDLTPLVYFNNGTTPTPLVANFTPSSTASAVITLSANAPFGTDGIAIFYKGNNAVYVKAQAGKL